MYPGARFETLETRALLATVAIQNFDGVSEPDLPAGWTTSGNPWRTTSSSPDTAPNSAFAAEQPLPSASFLLSPKFIAPTNAQILFRNQISTQAFTDGGVFEISINGGAFADITFVGGSFATGGYVAAINAGFGNPLTGRLAWTGNAASFFETVVNLPASAFGQSVQVRWVFGTDSTIGGSGWKIDTIRLSGAGTYGEIDLGDAPAPYPVTLAENGARHLAIGPRLGTSRDTEAAGTHSAAATFDGVDEDGVSFGTIRVGALGATATVNVQGGSGKLDGWIDFNKDGNWGGPDEQIFANVPVASGTNTLKFDVPSTAVDGLTFARLRLSTSGNLGPESLALDGEVEDYAVTITKPAVANGLFSSQRSIVTGIIDSTDLKAADVDGDGDMDLLSSSFLDDTIAWHENKGGLFETHAISTTADGAISVYGVDLDGDGDLDVLSASFIDDKVAWYENNGNEVFTTHVISKSENGAASVNAADLDSDGDLDVLIASRLGNSISWYENNGAEVFTAHRIIADILDPSDIAAADMDADGDMDILSAWQGDGVILWLENNGSEVFSLRFFTRSAEGAIRVIAVDVDSDGDMDAIGCSLSDHTIAWYENNGSGNFTTHTITTTANRVDKIFAADMDGDGDPDILSASEFGSSGIVWYKNSGTGVFSEHTINSTGKSSALLAADLDKDGDLDVLSASAADDQIVWYENGPNIAPVIGLFDTPISFTENSPPVLLDSNATVTDPDSSNFATGSLTVQLTNNGQSSDRLEIRNQGVAAGQIGVSGSNVTYGGAVIGTVTGGIGTTPLLVTFNTSATPVKVQALLRNLTFRSMSEAPGSAARVVLVSLTDGDGGTSNQPIKSINIVAVNDAPVVGAFDTAISYTENATAVLIDANATVADPDSANFATGKLTVQLITAAQTTDRIEIRNQGVGVGLIGVSGVNITFGSIVIGTFAGGIGVTPLVVTFNTNATPSRVQALLRNVTYRNLSETPVTTARVVRVTLTDGDGGTSNLPTKTINVIAVNDAPIISGFDTAVSYSAGSTGVLLDANAVVSDADSANFAAGKLTVQLTSGAQATDRLEIRHQGVGAGQIGVSGSNVTFGGVVIGTFTGGTGANALVVTFNTNATPTIAQSLLRNIRYRNTSATPSIIARTVRVSLTDGDGGTSNLPTKQINLSL